MVKVGYGDAAMKKPWRDTAKLPPKESTLQMQADFGRFTETMRRIVNKGEKPKPASPGPVAS